MKTVEQVKLEREARKGQKPAAALALVTAKTAAEVERERQERIIQELRERFSVQLPTAAGVFYRTRIFEAERRPKESTRDIDTAWGKATVKGRLGQSAADFLEGLLHFGKWTRVVQEGLFPAAIVQVDRYRVRRAMGVNYAFSSTGLDEIIADLQQSLVEVSINGELVRGQLIGDSRGHARSSGTRGKFIDPEEGAESQPKVLDVVVRWPVLLALATGESLLFHDPRRVAVLRSGIAQAFARHVLTHRDLGDGWFIDTILKHIGGGKSPEWMRRARMTIWSKQEQLAALGIVLVADEKKVKLAKECEPEEPA
jgi:hypothetical protein